MSASTFRQRLRDALSASGLSARAASGRAGLAHAIVAGMIRGDSGTKHGPGIVNVEALADVLGVSPEWLAFGTGPAVAEGAPPASPTAPAAPVPMLIWCPMCKARHIDEGRFATHAPHTHSCQECGCTWRPAVVATVGVQFLPGFKNEPLAALRAHSRFISDRPGNAPGGSTDMHNEKTSRDQDPGRRHSSVVWDWQAEVGHDGAPFWDDATDALDWALASIAARAVDAAEAGDPGALRAALSLALGGHVDWMDWTRLLGSVLTGRVPSLWPA